ncbi:hypothetical protein DYI23_14050 [Roseibium polysiphoniae]|uniref:Uncharacterized protein n=1 Tax=Roseibium polysiphoniae TaxID=2571221 RepID=A0A944CEX9_9HYPH|nr:hypothetical protein [Roseibium polysiphoniae]MBS8261342.1 hypothetical protein [Roseibium polysiphoniae]
MNLLARGDLKNIILAGLAGELAFELYGWLVSPVIFGVRLEPANLVAGLAGKFLGLPLPYAAAFAVHFLIGAVVFSSLVLLMQRVSRLSFAVSGALVGLLLWFVAQGFLAQLVGRSFMMGFGAYTQSSFVGHVSMMLIIGLVFQTMRRRQTSGGDGQATAEA